MRRIAAPMVGGMVSVAVLTLAVIPAAYLIWRTRSEGIRALKAERALAVSRDLSVPSPSP